MESALSLMEWLAIPTLEEDTKELPWNKSVRYVPIESAKKKILYMELAFEVAVNYYDNHFYSTVNPFDKDIFFSGTIRIEIVHKNPGKDLFKSLVGSSTFSNGQYQDNFQYAAIAKSLAIVNAFSSEYPQFGKGLNDREDAVQFMKGYVTAPNFRTSAEVKSILKNL